MSHEARDAVWKARRRMEQALAELPAEQRGATPLRVWAVATVLGERFRRHRGYVDETVEQIAEVVGFDPRRALRALHAIGMWVEVTRGGGRGVRTGSRRVPGPLLELGTPELGTPGRSEFVETQNGDGAETRNSHAETQNSRAETQNVQTFHSPVLSPDVSPVPCPAMADSPISEIPTRSDDDDAGRANRHQALWSDLITEGVEHTGITAPSRKPTVGMARWLEEAEETYGGDEAADQLVRALIHSQETGAPLSAALSNESGDAGAYSRAIQEDGRPPVPTAYRWSRRPSGQWVLGAPPPSGDAVQRIADGGIVYGEKAAGDEEPF